MRVDIDLKIGFTQIMGAVTIVLSIVASMVIGESSVAVTGIAAGASMVVAGKWRQRSGSAT